MKKVWAAAVMAIVLISPVHNTVAEEVGFEIVDSISGSNLKLIQSAMTHFSRTGLGVEGYRIKVVRWNGRPVVIFVDENKRPGTYGRPPGGKPGFEVEFSEDGSRINRSYFPR